MCLHAIHTAAAVPYSCTMGPPPDARAAATQSHRESMPVDFFCVRVNVWGGPAAAQSLDQLFY